MNSTISNFSDTPFLSNFVTNVSKNFYSLMSYPSLLNFSVNSSCRFNSFTSKNISSTQRKETIKPVKTNRKKIVGINRRVNQPLKGTHPRYCPMVRK